MKAGLILFLILFSILSKAQSLKEINTYVAWIDSMRYEGQLKRYFYPNMSFCAGALYGYYYQEKLVYMDSHYGAEAGFSSREVYLKDTLVCKIRYREHFADWNAYGRNYPDEEEFDETKMIYTDTLYTFWLSENPVMYKSAGKKTVSEKEIDPVLLQRLLACTRIMRNELEKEREER